MVRRHTTALRASLMAADFLVAAVLFVVVSMARYGPTWQEEWHRLGVNPWLAALAYGGGWTLLLSLQGLYRVRARYALRSEASALVRAGAVLGIAMVIFLFLQHVSNASRLLIAVLVVATIVLTILERAALRSALASMRSRGRFSRYVLVAGTGPAAVDFARRLTRNGDLGLRVIGYLRAPNDEQQPEGTPVLGNIDEVEQVIHDHVVDEVAICLPVADWNLVEAITQLCANEGKIVRIPDTGGPAVSGGYAEDFDGLTVVSLVYGPDRALSLLIKRLIDLTLSSIGLVLVSPLLLGIALVHTAQGRRAGDLPPDARRPERPFVLALEVPNDGPRRGPAGRPAGAVQRSARQRVQDHQRSAVDAQWRLPAPDQSR